LRDALIVDKDNIDALQSLANLRMVRNKDKEAKQHIVKVYQTIIKIRDFMNEINVLDVHKK
jgi:hypothetical protein